MLLFLIPFKDLLMKKIFKFSLCVLCACVALAGTVKAQDLIPPKSPEQGELAPATAGSYPDLRLTPDKPEIIKLDQDVANIIVGNTDHLAVTPDSSRRLILIPRLPGATFLRVMAEDGSPIMERHVIIAAPKKKENYVRIRRACVNGEDGCQEYSMYYCPDMCHKLGLVEEDSTVTQTEAAAPSGPSQQPPAIQPADGVPNVTR